MRQGNAPGRVKFYGERGTTPWRKALEGEYFKGNREPDDGKSGVADSGLTYWNLIFSGLNINLT